MYVKHRPECRVGAEKKLVYVRFAGKVQIDEIAQYARRLLQNPSFHETFSEIVDLTQVEELDLSAQQFLQLADKVDPFSKESKRAFIVRDSTQEQAARLQRILRIQKIWEFSSPQKRQTAGPLVNALP